MRLPNGSPFDFYLTELGDHVHVTDDGLTLFHLRGLGYALNDGRSLRGLATIAESAGFRLGDTGEIVALVSSNDMPTLGSMLQLFSTRVIDWEAEHFSSSDSDLTLADEVERIMRSKAPNFDIRTNPTLRLSTGDEISFMLRWGEKYVDAIPASANATAARIRKAVQINRDLEAELDTLYIVDDRLKPELATHEVSLLGQVASAIRLSDFERYYQPQVAA